MLCKAKKTPVCYIVIKEDFYKFMLHFGYCIINLRINAFNFSFIVFNMSTLPGMDIIDEELLSSGSKNE